MATRLYDQLQAEINTMNPSQKAQFKRELAKVIPQAVKKAADKAKKAAEKPQAEGMSENVRKK
jgi:hypothetical protein